MEEQNKALRSLYPNFFVLYNRHDHSRTVLRSPHHYHPVGEFMLVSEGDSIISCENTITHVSGPYIVYFPPNIPHWQDNSASVIYERWCFPLSSANIGSPAELPDRFFIIQLTPEQCREFTAIVGLMHHYYRTPTNKWPHSLPPRVFSAQESVRLKYLLLLFLNELRPLIPGGTTHKPSYINDVCLYISEHPAENLSLDLLAERFFVGRTKLTRDFRRVMDMSVGSFIAAVRVNHIKELLSSQMHLSKIAELSDFSSESYLIRAFTRHTGLSPTQYRTMLETAEQEN
ncbi:MAG: helix-turn-helix transcriptional regulator [Ruminococcaceae bacterium]|nr:helix-turn-helix transcriptional regulator [Oscillospiraceae bacterium]